MNVFSLLPVAEKVFIYLAQVSDKMISSLAMAYKELRYHGNEHTLKAFS